MTKTNSTTFPDDIFRCANEELRRVGFKSTQKLFPSDDLVVYVKPCTKDLAQYLLYRDSRSTGGNISVSLWLAPVQIPDDRIGVLGIGVNVVLYSDFDVSDSIIGGVTRKAIVVAAEIERLHDLVRSELDVPFVQNRRTEVYRKSLQIEKAISVNPENQARLAESISGFTAGNLSFDEVKAQCSALINNIGETWCEELNAMTTSQKARLLAEIAIARRLAT